MLKSALKILTFILLCIVTVWGIPAFIMWTYPICSWATGIDIGIWGFYVTGAFFIIAACFLWGNYSRKSWNVFSTLWIVAMVTFVVSDIFLILEKYGENGHYKGNYIVTHDYYDETSHYGLEDKWGITILDPEYLKIYSVLDKETLGRFFVAEHAYIEGHIDVFDKNGHHIKDYNKENDSQSTKDYIETNIGKILKVYVDKSERIFP